MAKPQNGCTNANCHGPTFQGGLDLASPGVEQRLATGLSRNEACNGQPLVDVSDPDNSLLLRSIDPVRFAKEPCGMPMPLGKAGSVSAEDLTCFEAWVRSITGSEPTEPGECVEQPFDPEKPTSYLRKVKQLLTGEPVAKAELERVLADPSAFKDVVQAWTKTPAFQRKMLAFFTTTFQQLDGELDRASVVSQLRGDDAAALFRPNDGLLVSLRESFARTAWHILEEGRPFTDVASTRRWMVTTGMLSYLGVADVPNPRVEKEYYRGQAQPSHRFFVTAPPAGVPANPTLAQQIEYRAWQVPTGCSLSETNDNTEVFSWLMGGTAGCVEGAPLLAPADFTDWREVELTSLAPGQSGTPFWDIPKLRAAKTLALRAPRVGYFTQPAFLAKWRTNLDNSFRVTTNQSLIVGLGESFDDNDLTIPFGTEGLAAEHAGPGTVCYSCHVKLDPMRNFFAKAFTPDTYSAVTQPPDAQPSFGFFGYQAEGNDLADFGNAIAAHPLFASAWTQRLCSFANSQPCDATDPEFVAIKERFQQSGFDFRALVVDLFSSPLVTGASVTQTHRCSEYSMSIARGDHLCHLLTERLGPLGACGALSAALPFDAWGRGAEQPAQPASPSLFYSAALESICAGVAKKLVGSAGSPLQSSNMPAALDYLVQVVMDLSPADERYATARLDLANHVAAAGKVTKRADVALQSAFTLACTSPFVAGIGL